MSMPVDETSPNPTTVPPAPAPTRRHALGVMATAVAATAVGASVPALGAPAQTPAAPPAVPNVPGLAPRADLVNVLEFEPQARLVLGAAKVAPIVGSDRTITDRVTLRPRVNISTVDLDLTVTLFGDQHFTPIIVGPIADQKRFNAEGEVATARGAAAAKAAMIVSSDSSVPLAAIAAAAGTTPLWVQVFAGSPKAKDTLAQAAAAKFKAVVVTVNAGASASGPAVPAATPIDWVTVEALVKATALPVLVKGIMRPADAKEAVARGAKGIIVSNYRGGAITTLTSPLLAIAPVVEAVGIGVPVLVDGSFRRGTDILKALALGARGVLVGRPVMWGLSAYGADGVQGVVEMLQTELGRYMCMCGRPSLAAVTPQLVRIHAAVPAATTTSHA
jgi:4-hydroxymandelate oxidase